MTKYSTMLKAKLQELLTARGLPVDGTKEILIERLEESDKAAAELDEFEEEDSTVNAVVTEEAKEEAPLAEESKLAEETPAAVVPNVVEKATVDATEGESTAEPSQKVAEEPSKQITPEELKTLAIEHLKKKHARATKFGEDDVAKALEADLNRIEKFGISIDSSISKELGFAPKTKPAENKSVHHKRPFKKFNNRKPGNFRGKNYQNQNQNKPFRGNNNNGGNRGRIYKTR